MQFSLSHLMIIIIINALLNAMLIFRDLDHGTRKMAK